MERAIGATPERHQELCQSVLNLYVALMRQLERRLSPESWQVLLRSLAGICDSLFTARQGEQAELGRRLSPSLMRVFFEALLRSRLQDPALWETLRRLVGGWTHLIAVVTQWNAVVLALTRRTLALLYGPLYEPCEHLTLKLEESVTLDLDEDLVLYYWHRMLTLLGNPSEFPEPKSFFFAMSGLEAVLKQALRVGLTPSSPPPLSGGSARALADGNALLHLLGPWLFQAARLNRPGFDDGSALALRSLCLLFSTLASGTQYVPIYLAQLYDVIANVFARDGQVLISAILHASFVLQLELEGANVLVPAMLQAARRILLRRASDLGQLGSVEHLRLASLRILALCVPLASHFESTPLHHDLDGLRTYGALQPLVAATLLDALNTEVYAGNLTLLIALVVQFAHEAGASEPKFMRSAFDWLVQGLTRLGSAAWPREVQAAACLALSSFLPHLRLLSPNGRSEERVRHVVLQLSRCLLQLLSSSQFDDPGDRDLFGLALVTLTDWVQAEQGNWLQEPEAREALQALLELIVSVLRSRPEPGPVRRDTQQQQQRLRVDEVREAAEFALLHLLQTTGAFPSVAGAERLSPLVCEEDELTKLAQASGITREQATAHLRVFARSDARLVLSVMDQPARTDGPRVLVVMRSKLGKAAWVLRSVNLPHSEQDQSSSIVQPPPLEPCTHPHSWNFPPREEKDFAELLAYLDAHSPATTHSEYAGQVLAQTQVQYAREQEYLKEQAYHLSRSAALPPPAPAEPYLGLAKLPEARQLLANLGLASEHALRHLLPVPINDALLAQLETIDDMPERDQFRVGVVLVGPPQQGGPGPGHVVLAPAPGQAAPAPAEFVAFVHRLGWLVSARDHQGYLGGADPAQAERLLYYATYRSEVVFHVSPYLSHVKLLHECPVVIVWTHSQDPLLNPVLQSRLFQASAFFLVHPLQSGLYLLRVMRRAERGHPLMPVQDGMVVSGRVLPLLLRDAALNASRWALMHFAEAAGAHWPQLRRQNALDELVRRYALADASPAVFFQNLFAPRDALAPPRRLRDKPQRLGRQIQADPAYILPSTTAPVAPTSASSLTSDPRRVGLRFALRELDLESQVEAARREEAAAAASAVAMAYDQPPSPSAAPASPGKGGATSAPPLVASSSSSSSNSSSSDAGSRKPTFGTRGGNLTMGTRAVATTNPSAPATATTAQAVPGPAIRTPSSASEPDPRRSSTWFTATVQESTAEKRQSFVMSKPLNTSSGSLRFAASSPRDSPGASTPAGAPASSPGPSNPSIPSTSGSPSWVQNRNRTTSGAPPPTGSPVLSSTLSAAPDLFAPISASTGGAQPPVVKQLLGQRTGTASSPSKK